MAPSERPPPWLRGSALAAFCAASAMVPVLGIPAAALAVVAAAAWLPARSRWFRALFAVASLGASVGLVRFVFEQALPGIVAGGRAAASKQAVSRLREVLFAEDATRRLRAIDPDGDGIGSAGFLEELTGARPLRAGGWLDPTPLSRSYDSFVGTPQGPALVLGGFLYLVCLPTPAGGWTARPGEPVDDERAEREFVAYAWPASSRSGLRGAYALDWSERIVEYGGPDASSPYVGPNAAPSCDAAFGGEPSAWHPWRGKGPRAAAPATTLGAP